MSYRSGKAIKRAIIHALNGTELSVSQLERTANTSSSTMRTQLDELADLNIVTITHHAKSKHNGRPYRSVKLTSHGTRLANPKR